MSRIKQEIDKAIEHYGDQATVFRVVRRATKKVPLKLGKNRVFIAALFGERFLTRKVGQYCHHLRRLLPIDRPVTTERLRIHYQAMAGVRFMMEGGMSDSTDPWVQGALAGGPSDMSGLKEIVEKLERGESLVDTLEESGSRIENGNYDSESEIFGDETSNGG